MKMLAAIPGIAVKDMARSIEFYRDSLGFTVTHQDEGFAILKLDAVELHLTVLDDESWRDRVSDSPVVSGAESFLPGTGGCRFQIEAVQELHDRLEPLGVVHPNGALGVRPWGTTEFGALDPDGNGLTFYERS